MNFLQTLPCKTARRLAVIKQRLAGARPPAGSDGIMEVVESLGYVQFDPIRVVEQSHLLVLWSRLGAYDLNHFNRLLWKDEF